MKNFFFNAGNHSTASSFGLLLLRVLLGARMAPHGWAKIQGFSEMVEQFADPVGLGSKWSLMAVIGAEAGCAALLIAGLFTRFAAIPLAFTMAVAAFMVLRNDWDKLELPLVYFAGFLALAFTGAGKFSVDGWIGKK